MSTILNTSLDIIFTLVSTFMKLLLAPLDSIIMNGLPEVSDMILKVREFLNLCFQYIGWAIDALGIPSGAITLIISFYVLKYTIHMAVIGLKIIIGWVRSLK